MSRVLDFDDGFTSETVPTIIPVAAEDVSVTPAGNITSTDVQAALEEIQTDVDGRATSSALSVHVADAANPHAVTKSQVGLGNVDNTSDLNKPVSTAQQTALNLKQDAATAVTLTGTQALTNKDYDGGTASNTSRITLPKAAKTTLDALTRKAGTIVFDTTTNKPYYDDGSTLQIVGSGSGGNVNFIANGKAEQGTTGLNTYVSVQGFTTAGVDTATDTITITGHSLPDGMRVQFTNSGGSLPAGLSALTDYYVRDVTTNTFKVSTTRGGTAIDITSVGTGVHGVRPARPVALAGTSSAFVWSTSAVSPLEGTDSFLITMTSGNMGDGGRIPFTIDNAYKGKVLSPSFDMMLVSGTYSNGTSTTDSELIYGIFDVTNSRFIEGSNFKIDALNTNLSERFRCEFQAASNSTSYQLVFHCAYATNSYVAKVDNIAVSPNAYTFSSPVSDWQAYTPTYTGFGTVTSSEIQYRRVGDSLELRGNFTTGVGTAVEARMSLPPGLVSADTTKIPSLQLCDGGMGRASAAGTYFSDSVLIEPSVSYVTFGVQSSTQNKLAKANGNTLAQSQKVSLSAKGIPIAGASSSVQMADQTSTRVVDFAGYVLTSTALTANVTNVPWTTEKDSHAANSAGLYTVPVPGDYKYSVTWIANATGSCSVYLNGAIYKKIVGINNAAWTSGTVLIPNLKTGDTLSVRTDTGLTITGSATVASASNVSISRISGPSQIASSETVAASYFASANRTGTASAPFDFDSKEFDTHNAVTTGASWRFTAPISGIYKVSSNMVSGTSVYVHIFKNGTIFKVLTLSGAGANIFNTGTSNVALNSGDYIELRPTSSATITGGALSGNGTAMINIERIGNRG